MQVRFYETVEDARIKFAVIVASPGGRWVFCKHKERDTYECPGGHREPGESVDQTARRELREETGAVDFSIEPVCAYSVAGVNRVNATGEETFGMLYRAEIRTMEATLHSEMEKVILTQTLPEAWTYPEIQPLLLAECQRRGK